MEIDILLLINWLSIHHHREFFVLLPLFYFGVTMKKEQQPGLDRRGFLRSLGGGAGAAAMVATGVAVPVTAEAAENNTDKRKTRYQANSAHVQNFYRVNRY